MSASRVRVGDVLALTRSPVEPQAGREYTSIGLRSFGKGLFHYEPVTGDRLRKLRFFAVEPGRLVISNIKGWEGAVAVTRSMDADCIASNRFLQLIPRADKIDVGWAKWFFLSKLGNTLIQRASPGSADRNRTLSIERFEALEIPLPPIDEQRRVAAQLDCWQSNAQALLARLQGPLTAPAATAARLPCLVETVLSQGNNARTTVGELADFVSDTVHPGDDPAPAETFVGLQHVESHTGRRMGSSPLGNEKGRKFRFRQGDVVYGYLRPYLNKAWAADRAGLCSVDQYVLRPKKGVSAALLAHQLRSSSVLEQAMKLTHNLQLPRLRSGLLAEITTHAVDPKNVIEVLARLERVRHIVVTSTEVRRRQVSAASALSPSLLNQAFGGMK